MRQPLGRTGPQNDFLASGRVSNNHGIVPRRCKGHAEILQDQHGTAGIELPEQRREFRFDNVRDAAKRSRRRDDLCLQTAAALRNENQRHQFIRRNRNAARLQHGGQRGRAALIGFLRKECRFPKLYGRIDRNGVDRAKRIGCAAGDQTGCRKSDWPTHPRQKLLKISVTPTSSRIRSTSITMPITSSAPSAPAGSSLILWSSA